MKKNHVWNGKGATAALFFCLSLLASVSVRAEIRLARIFSDGAVLQRQKPVPVWGWANPGENLKVAFAGQTKTALAAADGKWTATFEPLEAGGPFELKISTGNENLTVKDLLVGEVWLCSGQSNMEWTVKQADNFSEEKRDADYPQIRHFYVEHRVEIVPQADLDKGEWVKASPATVGDFTAVGFFFAREIYKKLKVPVGLVHSSWGGSQIEGWISREGMASSDVLGDYGRAFPKNWAEADALLERNIKKNIFGDASRAPTLEDEKKYLAPGYDFSRWHTGGNPIGQWDWKGIWAFRGNGYMARRVDLSDDFARQETTLGLAEVHGYFEVYINGARLYQGNADGKVALPVPPNFWKAGENRLVVKLHKAVKPEWFGVGLMGSADDVYIAAKAEKIPLRDGWKMMPSFAEPHGYAHSSNNVGTAIYNGMIAPLVPYSMRGVLWYQGETNAGRSYQYRQTFPLLINDWRRNWNDDFYFYFVQLSSFGTNRSSNEGSGWAELREAQTLTLSLPKTGMAVTTDIGNADDIHPTNKQDVGRRLAANALSQTYGLKIPFGSPLYESVKFETGRAIISFKNTYEGLTVKDKYGYVRGFEIAGSDRKFFYAKAEIDGDKVIVSSDQVKNPVAVRYAWSDAPVDANLYNSAGFPASPFRTDDWQGVTFNSKFQ